MSCALIDGSPVGNCFFPASIPFLDGNVDMLSKSGGWIVVGSVGSDLSISDFSNRAGATKSHFLVTKGEWVYTTDTNYGDSTRGNEIATRVSGTSFASPIVAGVVALLIEKFPHLSANQIAQILFDTATDLGDAGVDDIYGNGLVNVKKAMECVEP